VPTLGICVKKAEMKAYWRDEQASVETADELRRLIGRVRALSKPTMLFLERAEGETLVVGLGASESVLSYVRTDGKTFHSLGDPDRKGVLKFWCRDQFDDFLAEMAVPESDAISAAMEFVDSREPPQAIRWEADW
jgi:hypothetical protein